MDILGASPSGGFTAIAEWTGLGSEGEIDLGDLKEDRIRVCVRLFGEELGPSRRIDRMADSLPAAVRSFVVWAECSSSGS